MGDTQVNATLKHIEKLGGGDAMVKTISEAAAYGAAGASPREQMEFVWAVAVKYTTNVASQVMGGLMKKGVNAECRHDCPWIKKSVFWYCQGCGEMMH